MLISAQRLRPSDEVSAGDLPDSFGFRRSSAPPGDMPYRIELWTHDKTAVESVLATTTSPGIGFAAYFAATREYPDRLVALRHQGRFVSRSDGAGY